MPSFSSFLFFLKAQIPINVAHMNIGIRPSTVGTGNLLVATPTKKNDSSSSSRQLPIPLSWE